MLDDIILAVLVYFATFLFMFFILAFFFAFWYISVPLLVIYIVIKFIRQAKECERICVKLE